MKIQDLKSAISQSLTQAAIAAVIVYYSSKMEKSPDAIGEAIVSGMATSGFPIELIPGVIEADETKLITKAILTDAVVRFFVSCQAGDETIELARDMIAVNMTDGLLSDFDLAGAVQRAVEKRRVVTKLTS